MSGRPSGGPLGSSESLSRIEQLTLKVLVETLHSSAGGDRREARGCGWSGTRHLAAARINGEATFSPRLCRRCGEGPLLLQIQLEQQLPPTFQGNFCLGTHETWDLTSGQLSYFVTFAIFECTIQIASEHSQPLCDFHYPVFSRSVCTAVEQSALLFHLFSLLSQRASALSSPHSPEPPARVAVESCKLSSTPSATEAPSHSAGN